MNSDRLRLAPILLVVLALLILATPAFAQVSMILDQTAFHPEEIVEVTVGVRNGGSAFSADVYVGALLPNGSAAFLTSLSPLTGVVTTLGADPRSFPPLFADVVVAADLETSIPSFLSLPLSDQLPRGEYRVFVALVRAGTLEDGRVDPGDLFGAVVQPFTFVDVGTGLSTAAIELSPSSPTPSDAISVRLSGVWPDGCVPGFLQLRITGGEVRIDTGGAPAGTACLQVLSPWELTVVVGQLAAGAYRVVVINSSQGRLLELGRQAFEVR